MTKPLLAPKPDTKIEDNLIAWLAFNIKFIGQFISLYIVYMELVSIAENCKKLGVEMPEKIKEKLNNDDNVQ